MPVDCQKCTSGGKGNLGMFIERDPNICAAGLPTQNPDGKVSACLEHYLLKDEVDSLLSDAIFPDPKPKPLPPLRKPIPIDSRHGGVQGQMADLINPPSKTKYQQLTEDLMDTVYTSYWKKPLGCVPDPIPMFPEGYDLKRTFGKKTPYHGRLYDIVMPKNPLPDNTPLSKKAGVQTFRNYCAPPFDPDLTYGHRTGVKKTGAYVRCAMTDDRILLGNANKTTISSIQAAYQDFNQAKSGVVLAPNKNINNVPVGYSFGFLKPPDNLPECLTTCDIDPCREEFKKCLKALNTLRKCLKARPSFTNLFFNSFYLNLKYLDQKKTGWLPKEVVYRFCGSKFVRFDPALFEPLLSMWGAFDGNNIEYRIFVDVIDFHKHLPEMPQVPDVPQDCLEFETTYSEMVKPNQPPDLSAMAGLPSGRYIDLDFPITPERCCRADRAYMPHESDAKACLNPSVLTIYNVNHRDFYQKRDPDVVRKVFEAAYGKFSDEDFEATWEKAKKQHSQGWVCFETFRRALDGTDHKKEIKKIH